MRRSAGLIFFTLITLFSRTVTAQLKDTTGVQSIIMQHANRHVERSIAELKSKDSVSAFANIKLAESYLPQLSKKEGISLREKITSFYVFWINIKNPASRGNQDEESLNIQNLAKGLTNKKITEITETEFFSKAANLALVAKSPSFYVFAKISYAESLFDTGNPTAALPVLDTLSNEALLTPFEKMHILSLLVINSIKLNEYKNVGAYFNQLQTLNRTTYSKIDQWEYLLAGAWYAEHINELTRSAKLFKLFLSRYRNVGIYQEQTAESLIRLGAILSKKNLRDSADYYLRQAKHLLAEKDVTAEANSMYRNVYAYYLQQSSINAQSAVNVDLDSSTRNKLENDTKQLEYRYKLELKKQVLKTMEQQRLIEQLSYKSNMQRAWIFIIILFMLLIIAVYTVLLFYQQRRQAIALKVAEIEKLKQQHRNEIMTTLANAQRAERQIIAEQLHDDIGSMLTVARLNLSGLDDKSRQNISSNKLKTVNEILAYLADTVRQMSHRLTPATMAKLGFKKAIAQIVEDINESGKINVEALIIGFEDMDKFTEASQTDLYHIIQELLQNIIKHAAASEASLQLFEHISSINLIVEDNGKGLGEMEIGQKGKGLNLLKNRVELYGGSINIESNKLAGTVIIIEIPIENIVNSGFKHEPEYSATLPG